MLPNLNCLSLHDVANTMGFYVPSEEEQATMNDDAVTLEKPLYTMTFRVRLADDGPNGEPRYKFFAPAELWRWVKDHDTLPSREGPIWYEDWWVLCNNYNPDHHDIPEWAHRLKRRSEYVAERAREQAAQAQEAARANARAGREEGEEGEEVGRLDAEDYTVYWTFYLKGHVDTALVLRFARVWFANYMRTVQQVRIDPSTAQRMLIMFDLGHLPRFLMAQPRQDITKLSCRVYFSTLTAARSFAEWLNGHIQEHGYAEAMTLMLGVSTAKPVVNTVALLDESDTYGTLSPADEAAIARQDAPLSLTGHEYDFWADAEIRTPPAISEAPAADPILAFRPPGSDEIDVTIRWRFWLKGPMDVDQPRWFEMYWNRTFSHVFSDAPGVPELRTSADPWYDRLWVWIHEEEPRIRGPRTRLQLSDGVIQRCEFALKLPADVATAWLSIVDQDVDATGWTNVAQTWFYVEPIKCTGSLDRPLLDSSSLYPLVGSPEMTEAEYNAWETWRHIQRFRAIGEPR